MNQVALITGASRGIGAATAILAAEAGYHVCINYVVSKDAAEQVAETCRAQGVKAMTFQANVGEPDAVRAMFAACDTQLGPVNLLVNNAGIIGQATRVANLTDKVLQNTFAVNVFGSFYCAREALTRMSTQTGGPGGVIINVSSIAAVTGSAGEYVHYAASKAAQETMTIGLAKECGPEGIRVNAVQAGTTDTEIHARTGNPDRPARIAGITPLGRIATAQDIAEAVIWLASDKARHASGAILRMGGGM